MTTKVSHVPKGANVISPYLVVRKAAEMLDFYNKVFGATETLRLTQPDGRIGHAEISIGGAPIMLADEFPEMDILSPKSIGAARPPVDIHLYVEDVDAVYRQALQAGGTSLREPTNQFYG